MSQIVSNEQTTADKITVPDVGTFYEFTDGMIPGDFDSMLFLSNTPLDDAEYNHFAGAIGYAWQATVKGVHMPVIHRHGTNGFYVNAPLYSSSRSNPEDSFLEFVEKIEDIVNNGSPVRRNGTQKVKGMPMTHWITVKVFIDQISEEVADDYVPAYTAPTPVASAVSDDVASLRAELSGMAALPSLTSREKYFMEITEKALALAEAKNANSSAALEALNKAVAALS